MIGDNIGFAIGHFGGRRFAESWGHYVLLTPARLDRAAGFFDRHGAKVITLARFIEGLRQANGIVAGTTGMHWRRFLIYNAIGAALWVGLWAGVGYLSGSHIGAVYDGVTRYARYLAVLVGFALLAYAIRRVVRAPARN